MNITFTSLKYNANPDVKKKAVIAFLRILDLYLIRVYNSIGAPNYSQVFFIFFLCISRYKRVQDKKLRVGRACNWLLVKQNFDFSSLIGDFYLSICSSSIASSKVSFDCSNSGIKTGRIPDRP